jgi:PKD repeat protein
MVKGKKENMDVSELFRRKLEYSEVVPGESVRSDLMRMLGRKEFVRFNPSRFNIFYLGGLVAAAAIIGGLLLTPKTNETLKTDNNARPAQTLQNDSIVNKPLQVQGPAENISIHKSEKNKTGGKESVSKSNAELEKNASPIKNNVSERNISPSGKSDSLFRKAIIIDNLAKGGNDFALQMKTRAAFDISSASGCTPFKVKFINRSVSYDSCRWTFGDGGYSTEKDPVWIFDREGEYKIILKVFGSGNIEATFYSIITVHPKPVAIFEINPENPAIPDDEVRFLNYSENAVKFRWDFGDGKISDIYEPVHKYNKYGNYNVRLIVWSDFGCPDSLLIRNAFSGSGNKIEFPNAFIPNPDGPAGGYYSTKSDEGAQVFHPVSTGVIDFKLRVFSKNGILIFESNDINMGWDGYNKGQLCEPGVYIWKVRGTFKNGEPFVKMGDVTLLKNK